MKAYVEASNNFDAPLLVTLNWKDVFHVGACIVGSIIIFFKSYLSVNLCDNLVQRTALNLKGWQHCQSTYEEDLGIGDTEWGRLIELVWWRVQNQNANYDAAVLGTNKHLEALINWPWKAP
jgi:hypothetical protein